MRKWDLKMLWRARKILIVIAGALVFSQSTFPFLLTKADAADAPKTALNMGAPPVFIQQEHEWGSKDPHQVGTVFHYYEPIIKDHVLLSQIEAQMGWVRRNVFWLGRKLGFGKPFENLSFLEKIRYLELLEENVGPEKSWSNKTSRLLKRRGGAPTYLADWVNMELLPTSPPGTRLGFDFPEITTHPDRPAKTPEEAIQRAKTIIENTGHDGSHFHVFVTLTTEKLRRQKYALVHRLQNYNDVLFLEAVGRNFDNAINPALNPWQTETSHKVIKAIDSASPDASPLDRESTSPKMTNLAFRYWGTKNNLSTISLELRGIPTPLNRKVVGGTGGGGMGMETSFKLMNEASLSQAYQNLLAVHALGVDLSLGKLSDTIVVDRNLEVSAAEALLRNRAGESLKWMPLAEFSRRLFEQESVPKGLIYPLASPGASLTSDTVRAVADVILSVSHSMATNQDERAENRLYKNRLEFEYAQWARAELPAAGHRFRSRCKLDSLK